VRQLLVESLVLSIAGVAVGTAIAYAMLQLVVAGLPVGFPRVQEIGMDFVVLGFTLVTVFVSTFAFGLVPALTFSRPALNQMLREGGSGSTEPTWQRTLRAGLVTGEVALAVVLLVGGMLLGRSFIQLIQTPLGIDIENVIVVRPTFPATQYDEPRRVAFFEQLRDRLKLRPNVQAAALSSMGTIDVGFRVNIRVEGYGQLTSGDEFPYYLEAGEEVFQLLRPTVIRGRAFEDGEKGIVATEGFVQQFFPDRDPLGQIVGVLGPNPLPIVGVIADFRQSGLTLEPLPTLIDGSESRGQSDYPGTVLIRHRCGRATSF
jgi:hypothetical protein